MKNEIIIESLLRLGISIEIISRAFKLPYDYVENKNQEIIERELRLLADEEV